MNANLYSRTMCQIIRQKQLCLALKIFINLELYEIKTIVKKLTKTIDFDILQLYTIREKDKIIYTNQNIDGLE